MMFARHVQNNLADGDKPDGRHFDSKASRRLFFGLSRKDSARTSIKSKYHIMGFISSGTYGRAYEAHIGGNIWGEPLTGQSKVQGKQNRYLDYGTR
jgi:hypothetical protein